MWLSPQKNKVTIFYYSFSIQYGKLQFLGVYDTLFTEVWCGNSQVHRCPRDLLAESVDQIATGKLGRAVCMITRKAGNLPGLLNQRRR